MTTSLRIAEVADRVGISPATVRYYERIGLVPESERAANGYRVFNDVSVERLEFIGRAKQLGCSLDEIRDLVAAWEGGECGPIQDRLRSLVADKLAGAQAEIIELVTLTADLRHAAAALERHRPVGPCDDTCGCVPEMAGGATEPSTTTPIALAPRRASSPIGEPIACTLAPEQIPGRLDHWNAVLAGSTRTSCDGGVRLVLGDDAPIGEIARLAAAEQDCCRFFSFRLTIDARCTALEVTAPDGAIDIVHAAFGAPG